MASRASKRALILLATTALGSAAAPALAQNAGDPSTAATPPHSNANSGSSIGSEPGDIVVTATRQGDTLLSRVPMSIVAKTQASLDQQSVKAPSDISRVVPALRIDDLNATSSNVSIRGVRSEVGPATTGVYIDDTALQARTLGGSASGGGVFIPPLFDLQRVEVLKGPQGTLYGGSSEGGTVRFISTPPSLTDISMIGQAEVNHVEHGDFGYEAGAAIGGPLVQDKLGVRVTAFLRRTPGYLNYIDWRNQDTPVSKDDNWRRQRLVRAALAWAPTDNLRFTPTFLYADDKKNKFDEIYRSIPSVTTPAYGTYLDAAPAGSPAGTPGRGSPLFGRWTSGTTGGLLPAGYVPPTTNGVVTNIPGAIGRQVYIHAAQTYPALNLGPYDSLEVTDVGRNYTGAVTPEPSGRANKMYLGNFVADWDAGPLQFKSVTSYMHDSAEGTLSASLIGGVNITSVGTYAPTTDYPFLADATVPLTSIFPFHSSRKTWSEEGRITHPLDSNGLSFVLGFYYSDATTHSGSMNLNDRSTPRMTTFGIGQTYFPIHTAAQIASLIQQQIATNLSETSAAVFGEGNYQITDTLRLTLGARYSREKVDYDQRTWGLLYNAPFGVGTLVAGRLKEKPFTPKASISWQVTPDDLVYLTAAKGYRIGGVQAQANPAICGSDLASLNITNTPATYGSDTVWNYEGGAKVRLFDRALQLSGSLFYVQWNKPQTPYRLPTCAFTYVTNIGKAVSKGLDVQGTLRAAAGLTIDFAVAYTDAHFTRDVLTQPNATGDRQLLVGKGMKLMEVPEWTGNVSARYEFGVGGDWKTYLFGSYQYTGSYKNTLGPGVLSYAPDAFTVPAIPNVLARIGIFDKRWDLSVYVDNVFGNKTLRLNDLVGRASCRDASCNNYASLFPLVHGTALRPRTVGLTGTVRY